MKKKLTRLFSVLLAAVLVFGTLPISAMGTDVADPPAGAADESAVESLVDESSAVDDAAQPEEQSAEDEGIAVQATDPVDGYDMNVFLLDCGRKYYSVNNIKTFIDEASDAGFNYIQLVVGNEGLRFLLNDMSVQDYSSDDVKVAIQQGNLNYNKSQEKYTPDTNELTQDEMDTIIDYAYSKGMGVIPCVNSPGHMTAILSAANTLTGKDCAYSNSTSRIEVTNSAATEFTQALLQKYIDYFAGKGCKYFNMGADEYDFNGIKYNTTKYKAFISYINSVAKQIEDAGMTPMAFNDGIYYAGNTNCGTIDPKIVVFYWTYGYDRNGRGGYVPTSTSNLSDFKLINTNESYYWALNDNNEQYKCTGDLASKFDYKKFVDGTTPTNVKGSMFCVWSDQPGYGGEDYVIEQTKDAIAKFGTTLPTVEKVSKPTDSGSTGITITPAENNDGTLTVGSTLVLNAGKTATWTAEPADIVELTSADETAAYSNGLSAQKVKVTAKQTGDVTITASDGDQTASYPLTVQASDVDLGKVASLEIQYWITNQQGEGRTTGKNSCTISASATGVATDDGADIYGLLADKEINTDDTNRFRKYWQTRMLNKSTEEQKTGGADRTSDGIAFTKVRYNTTEQKWQVLSGDSWENVYENPQFVAYFMEDLDISKNGKTEINVGASAWGTKGASTSSVRYWPWVRSEKVCSLSFQIVYESGTTNPSSDSANDLISKTFFYNYYSNGRGIGTINLNGNGCEIYKVTATTGDLSYNSSNPSDWGTATLTNIALKWNSDETDVWTGDGQESVTISNPGDAPETDGKNANLCWCKDNKGNGKNNSAILIRIYIKSTATDNLNVHYQVKGENKDFHTYKIGINDTSDQTFKDGFGLAKDESGNVTGLVNNTVTNFNQIEETVRWKLSDMPSIPASYRYAKYELVEAYTGEDKKDAYLIYTFDNTESFMVDFGTPLTLQPTDIHANLSEQKDATITGVTCEQPEYGTVTVDDSTHNVTYTPNEKFASSTTGDKFNVTYTGELPVTDDKGKTVIQKSTVTHIVYIYPASNVLYEENFLENKTEDSAWTEETKVTHTTAQQTQKTTDTNKYVFGYDDSYDASNGDNDKVGAWKIDKLEVGKNSEPLTTEFYGNAFDLIGNCDKDTGRVLLLIKEKDSKNASLTLIDTRYNNGVIYQVPLAHVTKSKETTYEVKVYASGLAKTTVTTPNGIATMSLDAADDDVDAQIAQILDENDLTMDDVTISNVSVMDNVDAMDVPDNGIATYASGDVVEHEPGTHVEINGFRVYRSTASTDAVAQNYPANEQNVAYTNILDVVKNEITAYTEADSELKIDVQGYEASGGPQNEIYLASGQFVYFKADVLKGQQVQVSLRAVKADATASVEGTTISLTSNTEMYYTLTANDNGEVTIANNGTGLLAIGNVKLPDNVSTESIQSASEAGNEAVLAALKAVLNTNDEPAEVFTPETFTAKTTSTKVIRNKVVTLKVNVSSDVAYVTVNGVKYTRTGLQSMFQKTRTIRVVNTVPKNQTKTYEVIAYNADGVASEAITVTG